MLACRIRIDRKLYWKKEPFLPEMLRNYVIHSKCEKKTLLIDYLLAFVRQNGSVSKLHYRYLFYCNAYTVPAFSN